MCKKEARLSPPGSCSAVWRVPCREEEGLGKINANPGHFLGLVTGGWRATGGQGNQGRPDTGSDPGWTQPGQASALQEEAGRQGRDAPGKSGGSETAVRQPGQTGQIPLLLHRVRQGISGGEVQGQKAPELGAVGSSLHQSS